MKRKILWLATLALVAAACGDGAEPGATTTATPVPTSTTAVPSTTTTTARPATTTGAPTTTAAPIPTTTTLALIIPGENEDVDAIVAAYAIVFDSETTYEQTVPYLTEPEGLEDTVQRYTDTADVVGRITVEATAVDIDGETASVTYTILFGGAPTYRGQIGDAILSEGGWQVPRETFCVLMDSARVGCPAS